MQKKKTNRKKGPENCIKKDKIMQKKRGKTKEKIIKNEENGKNKAKLLEING